MYQVSRDGCVRTGEESEMDTVSPEKRSWIMAQVKSRGNRSTEVKMIDLLRQERITGWRRNYDLLGSPDLVFPKEKVAVFLDGCFWHGHPTKCRMPRANRAYWEGKIARNVARDRRITRILRDKGWKVIRIWEDVVEEPRTLARLRKALT